MIFSNIKARILKYCDLSWQQVLEITSWSRSANRFNAFEPEFPTPSKQVAVATDATGKTLAYVPFEKCFIVSEYVLSPELQPDQAQQVGDSLDAQISDEAARQGLKKVLLVVPRDLAANFSGPCKEFCIYEREINTFNPANWGIKTDSVQPHLLN